jgi:hypothetical protein
MVISERTTGKDFEGSLISRFYPSIRLEALRKTTKNLSMASLWAEI